MNAGMAVAAAALLMLATAAATVLVVRRVARWRTRRLLAAQVVPDGVDWSAVEQRVMQWPDHEDDTDCWCVRCYRAEIGRLAADEVDHLFAGIVAQREMRELAARTRKGKRWGRR